MKGDKKVLLLGAMMELGADSKKEHASLITLIDAHNWEAVILVGENFNELKDKYMHFENAQILIKGSRSMQMEKVLE
ncbi:MAG: hypothetical protein M3R50_08635 [Bacteroidota bacterium]|nr:hypothetical protein [Bacteroidota bacterium]